MKTNRYGEMKMSFFDGLNETSAAQGTPKIAEGSYTVTIGDARLITSQNPQTQGHQYFVIDVTPSRSTGESASPVGVTCSVGIKVSPDPWEYGRKDVKRFVLSALGDSVDVEAVLREIVDGNGNRLKGRTVGLDVLTKTSKGGNGFLAYYPKPAPAPAIPPTAPAPELEIPADWIEHPSDPNWFYKASDPNVMKSRAELLG